MWTFITTGAYYMPDYNGNDLRKLAKMLIKLGLSVHIVLPTFSKKVRNKNGLDKKHFGKDSWEGDSTEIKSKGDKNGR